MTIQHFPGKEGENPIYSKHRIAGFLHKHLDQYGDTIEDISKCLDYVFHPDKGGDVFICIENEDIIGAVVMNRTGMQGYIPENILVYIAVQSYHRGRGVGKRLMQAAIAEVEGSIALHVEPDNPAFHLYKKLGFTNKYLEMRLTR